MSIIITDTKTISIGFVLLQASENIAFGKAARRIITKIWYQLTALHTLSSNYYSLTDFSSQNTGIVDEGISKF